jgi:phosphoribosylformylglycinamidine synthase
VNHYLVEVIISNKPHARDPEGETIIRDLIHKEGFQNVKNVRTGKLLTITIEAEGEEDAHELAFKMCNDLRLFNPVAHSITLRVETPN